MKGRRWPLELSVGAATVVVDGDSLGVDLVCLVPLARMTPRDACQLGMALTEASAYAGQARAGRRR